jgi:pimeloyl-ACP methyl ester carboxylesterase
MQRLSVPDPRGPERVALTRRALLAFVSAVAIGGGRTARAAGDPPILFVHGDSDSAVIFDTVLWRFESNGWDPKRLFTVNFSHPVGVRDYSKPNPNRSTFDEEMKELAARVAEVLAETGEDKLILVAHSRGGNAVRHYIKNGGGAAHVSVAILAATGNHGVRGLESETNYREFHKDGAFLRQLNDGPTEAVAGIRWLTLRSDNGDEFFQPTRVRFGHPEEPSGIRYDGPELTGATNVVLPGLTHGEVLKDPAAFGEMYRFITGREPTHTDIVPEAVPVLSGMITRMAGDDELNIPFVGALLEIYEVSSTTGERLGAAVHQKTTGADGVWGPFGAKPDAYYEFVMSCQGYPVNHIYWAPFPRSSSVLHLRPRALHDDDRTVGSAVVLFDNNGSMALGHGTALIDGAPAPGLKAMPLAHWGATLRLAPGELRAVPVVLNAVRLTVRNWPVADNHVVIARPNY